MTSQGSNPSRESGQLIEILVLLIGLAAAIAGALKGMDASFDGERFHPVGADSFYHARRILDTAENPANFFQFDPQTGAPNGALVEWPWAYDLAMAMAVRLGGAAWPGLEPLLIAAYMPVLAIVLNACLLMALLQSLRLPLPLRAAAFLLFCLSPMGYRPHFFANLDHHFIELTFLLAVSLAGVRWLETPARAGRAVLTGILLGLAPAFHVSLFLLQLPLLGAVGLSWVRGNIPLPARSATLFSTSLVAATFVAVLPSLPFGAGHFSHQLLSWFHLYVACLSALFVWLFARLRPAVGTGLGLASLAVLLAAPLLANMLHGFTYLAGRIPGYEHILEVRNFPRVVEALGWERVLGQYSGALLLVPFALCCWLAEAIGDVPPARRFASLVAIMGLILMMLQHRFSYYAVIPVCLAGPTIAAWFGQQMPEKAGPWINRLTTLLMVTALFPALLAFPTQYPLGGAYDYMLTRQIYPVFRAQCDRQPGAVLARPGHGHFITYHTSCAVIADNMYSTPQRLGNIMLAHELLRKDPGYLRAGFPWIEYVYVYEPDRLESGKNVSDSDEYGSAHPAYLANPPPAGYQVIAQLVKRVDGEPRTYARLLRVRRQDNPPQGDRSE